MMAKVYKKAKK